MEAEARRWWLAAGGWLAGCALQLQQAALWPLGWYVGLALAAAGLGWLARRRPMPLALAVMAAAFALTGLRAGWRLDDALPAALEGQDLVLTGVVAQMPRAGPSGLRFVFEVESATQHGRPAQVPSLVSLGWYRGAEPDAALLAPMQTLAAGQRWRFTARLKQPHGSMNPDGFDLELWLFEQGIRAGGYVRSTANAPAERLGDGVAHPFERARQRVRDAIVADVRDPAAAGVLAALAVGDQAAIDGAWQ